MPYAQTCLPDEFSTHPPIYKFNEIVLNMYHLDSLGIPNALLQKAFNKIFIPLSMLTATSMNHIRYNRSLKYHKIIFGNSVGKYSLNKSSFPDELSLNESEFWQAYRTWLVIIDMISDLRVAASWKAHHSRMITDTSFSTWFQAWHEHDRLLRSQFVLTPFIVLPDSMEYHTQFEQCRNDQAYKETMAVLVSSWKAPASSSTTLASLCFTPYDNLAPHPFWTTLCVHCGI